MPIILQTNSYTSFEREVVEGDVNGSVFAVFLLGVYTPIHAWALYSVKNKTPENLFVFWSLCLLYLINIGWTAALNWYFIKSLIEFAGDPGETFFLYSYYGPSWSSLVNDILVFCVGLMANLLFIWRFYTLWGFSPGVKGFPLFFSLCAMAFFVAVVKLDSNDISDGIPGPLTGGDMVKYDLYGVMLCMLLLSSLSTTFAISYRLLSTYRNTNEQQVQIKTSWHFKAFDIIVQSGAIYTLALAGVVTVWGIGLKTLEQKAYSKLLETDYFIYPLFFVIAGASPALMAVRVAQYGSPTATEDQVRARNNIAGAFIKVTGRALHEAIS